VPDFTILARLPWDAAEIDARCRDLAALLPGLAISVDGTTHCYADGLAGLLRDGRDLVEPFHVRTTQNGVDVDIAIAWHSGEPSIRGFVNCSPSVDGTHMHALRKTAHAVIARRFDRMSRLRVERHMLAVVHAMLVDPRYGNPSRDWLQNAEVGEAVRIVVERELTRHFEEAPAALDALLLLLEQRAGRQRRPSHI
jgi:DNA gyrase/topoisomerase IV subunit B